MITVPDFQGDVHAWFVGQCGTPPSSPLGGKPTNLRARRAEARRISALLASQPAFSFVRLGDMELTMLLGAQYGILASPARRSEMINGTLPHGDPGVGSAFVERLRRAYERASYVDFHERLWPVSLLLPQLALNAADGQYRNPDEETSYILPTWLEYEFRTYCEGRRVGFVGAEAKLLAILVGMPEFREAAATYWPQRAQFSFQQVRRDGKYLEADVDLIKKDISCLVRANSLDTVFLSLGGAANRSLKNSGTRHLGNV